MSEQHSESLITYRAYVDGSDLIGIVTVDLPTITHKTVDITGAGVAGTVSSPVAGQYDSMTMTLNFRTATPSISKIKAVHTNHIELWGAIQTHDPATGEYKPVQHKIIVRAVLKTDTFGKFESASTQDKSLEFEVTYLKEMLDGKKIKEIDKYNMLAEINGNDTLAAVRSLIGL